MFLGWFILSAIFCLLTAALIVLSDIVVLSSAVVTEMIGSLFAQASKKATMTYQMLANLEIALEGLGMVTFMYGVVDQVLARDMASPARTEPASCGFERPGGAEVVPLRPAAMASNAA